MRKFGIQKIILLLLIAAAVFTTGLLLLQSVSFYAIDAEGHHIRELWAVRAGEDTVVLADSRKHAEAQEQKIIAGIAKETGLKNIKSNTSVEKIKLERGIHPKISGDASTEVIVLEGTVDKEKTAKKKTEQRNSFNVKEGSTRVAEKGSDGKKIVTYAAEYKNGKLKQGKKVSEKVTVKPKNKVILLGTRVENTDIEKFSTARTVNLSDGGDLYSAIQGGNVTVNLAPGTYYIHRQVNLYSNTIINARGATIIQSKSGAGMIKNSNLGSATGYNANQNIMINGGTWVGTSGARSAGGFKEGRRMGADVINFLHSQNITIKNATIYNNYNAHLIEFTGCYNCQIINCDLGCYEKNGQLVKGFYSGSANNGAIQLDACYSAANAPSGGRFDGTPCRKIIIANNRIMFPTGVETAQRTSQNASDIYLAYNQIRSTYTDFILKNSTNVRQKKNTGL